MCGPECEHEHDMELDDLRKEHLRLENEKLTFDLVYANRKEAEVAAHPFHNGKFQIVGSIGEISVHRLINELEIYSRRYPTGGIEIVINSGGGSVLDGNALVDFLHVLRKRGHRVVIIGFGLVASMAGVIMQAADERVLTPRAWLGMHEISNMAAGTVTIQEDTLKFSKALQAQIVDLVCSRSSLTPRKLKSMWERKDVYLNSDDALKLGLIDRIEEI